jgi:hypothetical protein
MVGHSLESLLAWMKDDAQIMRGWDAIIALDGHTINSLLQQAYIVRLSQGADHRGIEGAIKIPGTNMTHYIDDFTLGAPVLSFEQASLQRANVALSMAVVGGTQVLVETVQGANKIIKLSTYDPLSGPQLLLDLKLASGTRSVLLDLAQSESALLTFAHTPTEQRAGGAFFQSLFQGLDNDKRVYAVGTFPSEGNPFMLTQSIDVRTQASGQQVLTPQGTNEEGAIILFVAMASGRAGTFPGDDSGFKYLIPDDAGKAYSGTALFSLPLIHRAAFGYAVLQLLDNPEFEYLADDTGVLAKMVAKGGVLQAAAGDYQGLGYLFESEAFSFPATGGQTPLTVEFSEAQAIQHWQATCTVTFRYKPIASSSWQSHTATFNIKLEHEFYLSADESGDSAMEGQLFVPYTSTREVTHVSGLPENIAPDELDQINGFIAYTVKRAVLERFSNTLTATSSDIFLADFDLAGRNVLQSSEAALPYGLAMFGQINSARASFSIVEQQPQIVAGSTLQLTTEPARSGLHWVVENPAGSASNPGSIDSQTGVYQAPPGHAMNGAFSRVLVIASDPASDERSETLVTVYAQAITVNPLIYQCNHDEQFELSAGSLGEGSLLWSIKNPVEGESGRVVTSLEPEGDHTYIAGPRVTSKTYVLDEIEVKNSKTGQSCSVYVLALQTTPLITVNLVEDAALPEGQVQLQASINGTLVTGQWRLPLGGPGTIDSKGLYSDNPAAKERFALVTVLVDDEDFGAFEGHMILPLPLTNFPTVLQALSR